MNELYSFVTECDNDDEYVYFEEDVIVSKDSPAIALCILSAINLGSIKHLDQLEELCELTVRSLDELIDYQEYPVKAAEIETKARRSLGIGYVGLAHYLAKHHVKYDDPKAWKLVHDLSEAFQYYLLKASNNLAKEKGPCLYFNRTKYSKGILPIDTYKKDVDLIVPHSLAYDWESLRADIVTHGLRHSTLSAQMPSESCLNWEHKILTNKGYLNFHEICEMNHISWYRIELNNAIGWFTLEEPLIVPTLEGNKEVTKIYFNGHKEVVSITLDNGKVIKCTPTHKFLVRTENNQTLWKHASELNENDDIIELNLKD